MKRTKFAGVLAAMLIFGSSTVYGATPSINLQNNANNTVTVKVQDIQKDIYGIQIELLTKDVLTENVVFESKDKDAYSFTVRDGNKLSIYITSNQILNSGREAVLGNLIDMQNNQFLDSANYKVVDYFFSPIDIPNVDVDHTGENTGDNQPELEEPSTPESPSTPENPITPNKPSKPVMPIQPGNKDDDEESTGNQGSVEKPAEPETPSVSGVEFADTKGHWAAESIGKMAGRGVLKGYEDGTFGPSKQITRAEFSAVVARAFGFEGSGAASPFKDAELGKWYTEPVVSLYEKGIVTGRPDGIFGVSDSITNQEMAVMISRSLKALAVELEVERSYVPFQDADTISSFAQDAVKELYEAGIISGMPDGTYQPKGSATRAQVAVIMDRILTMIEAR